MIVAGNVALISGFVLAATFCVLYGVTARWWRSEMGCHLMVFTGSLAAILGRLSVGVVFGWPLVPVERLGIYALVAVGLAWRLSIFIRTQILRRRSKEDSSATE